MIVLLTLASTGTKYTSSSAVVAPNLNKPSTLDSTSNETDTMSPAFKSFGI